MKTFTFEVGNIYTLEDIPETHREAFLACHHSGPCDADVEAALPSFAVNDPEGLRQHLKEYGAWDQGELEDHTANVRRFLWLAAADIQEQGEAYIGI